MHARPPASTPPTEQGTSLVSRRVTLTVEEAAELIGISRAQAYRGVKSGDIRAVQVGRRIVVPVGAVEDLLGIKLNDEDDTSPQVAVVPSDGGSRKRRR